MKKVLLGIVVGVIAGAAVTWFLLRPPEALAPKDSTAAKEPSSGIRLTSAQQSQAGILVATAERIERKPEVRAFGRVLDITTLITLLTELETSKAALAASAGEFDRLKTLGQNTSARALETAEAAAKRDRLLVASSQTRLLADWGQQLTSRGDLGALVQSLAKHETALVRVDVPAGEPMPFEPKTVRVAPLATPDAAHDAELIGPAPAADPQSQGAAFLVLV